MEVLDQVTQSEAAVAGLASDVGEAVTRLPAAVALTEVEMLRDEIAVLLASEQRDEVWLTRLKGAAMQVKSLCLGNPDEALYFLIYASSQHTDQYSATHAMACACVATLISQKCGWPAEQDNALRLAALVMNVSMTVLQDRLANQDSAPSADDREFIRNHAEESVRALRAAGLTDQLVLDIVEGHHSRSHRADLEALDPKQKLSEVLRRIDIYTAKLSRRKQRQASTPALAARDVLLGDRGLPDLLGTALLRVIGLYPPGSWVELANGDMGLVVGRGDQAHAPVVAVVRRADGGVYPQPMRRNTAQRGLGITKGLRHADMRVSINHSKVLGCSASC